MSPFKSPKSPSTPAAVHRIVSKAKVAKDKTSLSAAKAARLIHDEQADFHLAWAQAAADEEAALDIEIAQETSFQGIDKDYSAKIYKLDIINVAALLVSAGYNEDVTSDVVISCANLVVDVCMNLCAEKRPQLKRRYNSNPRATTNFTLALAMAVKHKMLVFRAEDEMYWFNDKFYYIMHATKGVMNEEAWNVHFYAIYTDPILMLYNLCLIMIN